MLTPTEARIINTLTARDGISGLSIGRHIGCPNLSQLYTSLQRLEAEGFIVRRGVKRTTLWYLG